MYKIPISSFQNAYLAAVDKSTILSYWKRDTRDKTDTKSAALLDMASGASDGFDEDGISENVDDVAAGSTGKLSFDEDRIPVVNDEILQSLQQEVSHVMENIKSMAPREHGRRRCPLCPFRSFAGPSKFSMQP